MKIEAQITIAALAAVKELYGTEVPEKMIQLQKHAATLRVTSHS